MLKPRVVTSSMKCLFIVFTISSPAVFAGEALSQEEVQARFQATVQEVVAQRDAAQARAANLAGDNAALRLELTDKNSLIKELKSAFKPEKK